MGNLLYVIAVILLIIWLLSFLAFHVTSGLIHLVLVAAVIIFLVKLIGGNRGV
ncbi:MAG: lmo0937 family membrane protein [Parafilimonas sp.]